VRRGGTVATLRFRMADQRSFAQLSGDFNPVHLNPIVARRIAAGEPIVHGVHLLLRALDGHFRTAPAPARVALSATFLCPALLNEPISVTRSAENGAVRLTIDRGVTLVEASISALAQTGDAAAPAAGAPRHAGRRRTRTPNVLTLSDIGSAGGVIDLPPAGSVRRAFPRAAHALGSDLVAAIVAISKLVGMECPGRDSLLSAVRFELTPHTRAKHLTWSVARADRRFGLIRMKICAPGLSGTVDAFLRPPLPPAPSIAAVRPRVAAGEFGGQRALVIGGSRGLGATAAMLLCSGGGTPLVTYATGRRDAEVLERDARAAGFALDIVRFDVLDDPVKRIADAAARFGATHIYYFATPRIFVRRQDPFDAALFQRFVDFYVSGFARVCAAVRSVTPALDVFYPSTTAIDADGVRELTEYAAAKAAGETLCRTLNASMPGLRILVRRLPRVATDQTATILPAPALDPVEALLPVIREMHRRSGEGDR
jgi:NAD(P)-dependent dehydrogenase (short-subunit alcohol dehydrogenase family)